MKKIILYTNEGDHEINIKDNTPIIIEIKNHRKQHQYMIMGTKIKQIIGRKHKEMAEMVKYRGKNTPKHSL